MKTLLIALSFCLLFILNSCNNTPKNSSKVGKLYIKTTTSIESGKDMKNSETISEITSDYFEVGLSSQTDGGYLAQKDIVMPKVGEPFKSVFFTVS